MRLGAIYEQIVDAAVDGHYGNSYFGCIHAVGQPMDNPRNMRRVRAVIQRLNLQFARQMGQYGSKYKVFEDTKEAKDVMLGVFPEVLLGDYYA